MKDLAQPVEIRAVDKFPEPDFSQLQRAVFAGIQRESDALDEVLRAEAGREATPPAHTPMVRVGAYLGGALVGWSYGWMERTKSFYMANSGVVAGHRRQGIYSALLEAVREQALSQGAVALRSQHSVLNNPVIIAKLRHGFHVSGLSLSAQMGTLVELTCHFSGARQEMYRDRAIPFVSRSQT
jgi:GNAT superfamily N-acetyltransferase